ncbi:MAG: pyridoxamine 5-phosphate oxidase-like protein [Acidimicrobiales bacterium]|nr:pyridoxamine 5-phosphate oxidase-like protein [Acidimicrobiales bacterium]
MSTTIDLADLPAAVAERGEAAFLVTSGDVRPHVVAVVVEVVDGALEVGAGRRTAANAAGRPEVTLLWPADVAHPANSLLVDGTATLVADGERLRIVPATAVLHRAGGRSAGGPC